MVTAEGLLAVVGTPVDGQLGIVGETLAQRDTGLAVAAAPMPSQQLKGDERLAALLALGHAMVLRQRVQGLQFGRDEEGAMAVHLQWALPFSVNTQEPQLLAVTGHVGGAWGVHMQTL